MNDTNDRNNAVSKICNSENLQKPEHTDSGKILSVFDAINKPACTSLSDRQNFADEILSFIRLARKDTDKKIYPSILQKILPVSISVSGTDWDLEVWPLQDLYVMVAGELAARLKAYCSSPMLARTLYDNMMRYPDAFSFKLMTFGNENRKIVDTSDASSAADSRKNPASPEIPAEQKDLILNGQMTLLHHPMTDALYYTDPDKMQDDPRYPNTKLFTDTNSKYQTEIRCEYDGDAPLSLSATALGLLDIAIVYLADNNYYGQKTNVESTVYIPFCEYAEIVRGIIVTPRKMDTQKEQAAENKRAAKRRQRLIDSIEYDLRALSKYNVTGRVTKGKNRGEYSNMRFISSHAVENNRIRITFDPEMAKFLNTSYPADYEYLLQKVNDGNPNAYRIGRAMLMHSSIDRNIKAGTQETLKVRSLLLYAPNIPNADAIAARGQRNWRQKIKAPLETVLDKLLQVGVIEDWNYRDARSREMFSSQQAENLSCADWENLNIEYMLPFNDRRDNRVRQLYANEQGQETASLVTATEKLAESAAAISETLNDMAAEALTQQAKKTTKKNPSTKKKGSSASKAQ